mmetsp:Transcript_37945/g.104317  ORF Transcript_37945/g.104317 Transcript_37945/m.104317 type:complete len:235 (+) Transcript_37945:243-947(+)
MGELRPPAAVAVTRAGLKVDWGAPAMENGAVMCVTASSPDRRSSESPPFSRHSLRPRPAGDAACRCPLARPRQTSNSDSGSQKQPPERRHPWSRLPPRARMLPPLSAVRSPALAAPRAASPSPPPSRSRTSRALFLAQRPCIASSSLPPPSSAWPQAALLALPGQCWLTRGLPASGRRLRLPSLGAWRLLRPRSRLCHRRQPLALQLWRRRSQRLRATRARPRPSRRVTTASAR